MAKRGVRGGKRGRPPSSSGPLSPRAGTGHSGRPAKRPRYLEDYEEGTGEDPDYAQNSGAAGINTSSMVDDNEKRSATLKEEVSSTGETSAPVLEALDTSGTMNVEDPDILYEDELHDLRTRRSRGRPRGGALSLRGEFFNFTRTIQTVIIESLSRASLRQNICQEIGQNSMGKSP